MIIIVDYGAGNSGSIFNMLKKAGASSEITGDAARLAQATKIILPGVGSFDSAMEKLNGSGLRKVLDFKALTERVPLLGICLGMQLLGEGSEEGQLKGLGWMPLYSRKFSFRDTLLKVPHNSWNTVLPVRESLLLARFDTAPRFYFSHSYYVSARHEGNILATTQYGITFPSVVQQDNLYGAQFHPEKSHRYGLQLLRNFIEL
jgi:glutamine amidotransferase